MTVVYFINNQAIFTGQTQDINLDQGRPSNSVLVKPPNYNPNNQFVVWSGDSWLIRPITELPVDPPIEPQPYTIPTYLLRQRAEKLGIWQDLTDYLVQYPALMLKTLTLQTGVDPKDADLINGLNDLQVPQQVQDYLLSDPSLGV